MCREPRHLQALLAPQQIFEQPRYTCPHLPHFPLSPLSLCCRTLNRYSNRIYNILCINLNLFAVCCRIPNRYSSSDDIFHDGGTWRRNGLVAVALQVLVLLLSLSLAPSLPPSLPPSPSPLPPSGSADCQLWAVLMLTRGSPRHCN